MSFRDHVKHMLKVSKCKTLYIAVDGDHRSDEKVQRGRVCIPDHLPSLRSIFMLAVISCMDFVGDCFYCVSSIAILTTISGTGTAGVRVVKAHLTDGESLLMMMYRAGELRPKCQLVVILSLVLGLLDFIYGHDTDIAMLLCDAKVWVPHFNWRTGRGMVCAPNDARKFAIEELCKKKSLLGVPGIESLTALTDNPVRTLAFTGTVMSIIPSGCDYTSPSECVADFGMCKVSKV
jgi:hypothetical protein